MIRLKNLKRSIKRLKVRLNGNSVEISALLTKVNHDTTLSLHDFFSIYMCQTISEETPDYKIQRFWSRRGLLQKELASYDLSETFKNAFLGLEILCVK